MACPLCGENCNCVSDANPNARQVVRTRFELDESSSSVSAELQLIDPEAQDRSEETFAASLEIAVETPRPRFVVGDVGAGWETPQNASADSSISVDVPDKTNADESALEGSMIGAADSGEPQGSTPEASGSFLSAPAEESWRDEVSARLKRYQARRRSRESRYPSLRLRFETPAGKTEFSSTSESVPITSSAAPAIASRQSVAMDPMAVDPATIDPFPADTVPEAPAIPESYAAEPAAPEYAEPKAWPTAKIIEFPGPAYTPPVSHNELAEPVVDRPRILEAPEVVTPPPTLGGILIEEERIIEPERRPGIDMPLQAAAMNSRILAAVIDCVITLLACGVFATIFYRIAGTRPPVWQMLGLVVGLPVIFWMAYQYLLVVYSGTTPGLRLAKLQLMHFDGAVPSRRRRRARVLASFLSGVSLGLGYLWQFLDEDALCWHDRVMKTYLAPIDRNPSA